MYKALQRGGKGRVHDLVAVKTLKGIIMHHFMHLVTLFSCHDHTGLFCSSDVKRLAEESQIMARFDHPNVMKLLGVSISKSRTPFIVMPFMARGTLLSYLRRNRENLTIEDEEMTTEQVSKTSTSTFIFFLLCIQTDRGNWFKAAVNVLADRKRHGILGL